ncbi:MAG: hypothetical protein AAF959_18705 [Cyanobacteria bacterium P01_D01_bin.56]
MELQSPTLNGMEQVRASGTIPVLSLDGGNTWLKYSVGGAPVRCVPAVIKELDTEVEEVEPTDDPSSVIIDFEGSTFVVGSLAESLGGVPVYQLGKPEHTHLLYMAAMAGVAPFSSCPVVERLNILVPDNRKRQLENVWEAVSERIQAVKSFTVDGQLIQPQVRNIKFISEGAPAYSWAKNNSLFAEYDRPGIKKVAVFDVGGGEATLQVFDSQTGRLIWTDNQTLPGLKALGDLLAGKLKPYFRTTPDTAMLLRALHLGNRIYESDGQSFDFTEQYESARKAWSQDILQKIQRSGLFTAEFGGVVIVGGGAAHCGGIENATGGRFVVAKHPEVSAQEVNAIAMLGM